MFDLVGWLVGLAEDIAAVRRGDPLSFYRKFWIVASVILAVLFVVGFLWALAEPFASGGH